MEESFIMTIVCQGENLNDLNFRPDKRLEIVTKVCCRCYWSIIPVVSKTIDFRINHSLSKIVKSDWPSTVIEQYASGCL